MLRRRRCCINAAVLIVSTFLFALMTSSFNTYGIQDPWNSGLPQPKGSLADRKVMGFDADPPLLNHSVSESWSIRQPLGIRALSQNDSYRFPRISDKLLKRFPQIMIVGFGKAGTRALYEALKLHPQLSGPYREKRFFSLHYSIGLDNYLISLPDPPVGGFTCEKSPDYIIVPTAPKRIKSAASLAGISLHRLKFVVVLRDPIKRAVSEYLEWNALRKSLNRPRLPPFEAMVVDSEGNVDATQPFINASCYAYHINNWLEYFSKEQMCYVDGDTFVSNPLKEIQILEGCLQLEHYFSDRNFVYNKERGFYCFQDPNSVSNPICMKKSKGRKHPNISEHVLEKLKSYFQPWNDLMPYLTGRSISWSNFK